MDSFIKKIFEKKSDELVHSQFIKFSKGEFKDRAMIRAKNISGKFSIATTYEYARELVMHLAEKLGENKTHVTGALMSTLDLDFDYEERKMAMGVRKYMLDREMTGKQILDLCKRIDKAFFGLSFNVGETEMIISPKSPKSAKGAGSAKKEDAKAKIDFIKIKTTDKDLVNSLIFDDEAKTFKNIEIKHDFIIEDIVMPKTNEKDFAKIREMAKRKGKIIRYLDIDGNKSKKEMGFEA
ncbi:MAG: hypothetical protein WCX73_01695 [Candidatus Pacearchaeota archaeon]|jgi:hypothetical protein